MVFLSRALNPPQELPTIYAISESLSCHPLCYWPSNTQFKNWYQCWLYFTQSLRGEPHPNDEIRKGTLFLRSPLLATTPVRTSVPTISLKSLLLYFHTISQSKPPIVVLIIEPKEFKDCLLGSALQSGLQPYLIAVEAGSDTVDKTVCDWRA